MLGQTCVGKTSISDRFVRNIFLENGNSTIGASFLTKTINLLNEDAKLDIWDTAGQERYESLAPFYYRGSDGIIIVYDITELKSFNMAINWIQRIIDFFGDNIPVIYLVGNKSDLEKFRTVHPVNVYRELNARFNNLEIHYREVSAKLGIGVQHLFYELTTKIKEKYKTKMKENLNTIKLKNIKNQEEEYRRTCCFF